MTATRRRVLAYVDAFARAAAFTDDAARAWLGWRFTDADRVWARHGSAVLEVLDGNGHDTTAERLVDLLGDPRRAR